MQKRVSLLPWVLIFLILSLFFVSSNRVTTPLFMKIGLDRAVAFAQTATMSFMPSLNDSIENTKHEEELEKKQSMGSLLVEKQEMQALRDQFETTDITSTKLLPAKIIGFVGFIPKVSRPIEIVIDKGSEDNVRAGLAVVYKNNLVGRVIKTSTHRSLVILLTKSGWSFTAKIGKATANGLAVVEGGDIFLKNVVLSDNLEKGDLVVTTGDENLDGVGFPPDIVVGEITSVEKEASALFQTAKVESLVDSTKLSNVFVYLPE